MTTTLTTTDLAAYAAHLKNEERSPATIEKYLRDTAAFARWLGGAIVTKERVSAWKAQLIASDYAPATINAMLSAVNSLFRFLGWEECRVKFLKVQRRAFRDDRRELSRSEYERLVATARAQGRERLALLMEAICSTGVRVSEVQYLTVEAAKIGQAEIRLKGKIRVVLLPRKLCRKLLKFAAKNKTASGEIFLTKSGKGLSRRQIWAEMKRLCQAARVAPTKVIPHTLRHLFARTFYQVCRDVVKLADVLGHSSIDTTRIYLLSTGTEHTRVLEQMHLNL